MTSFWNNSSVRTVIVMFHNECIGWHHDIVNSYRISVTDDYGYVPFTVVTFPSFSMTCQRMFKKKITRQVPLVEQELYTPMEYTDSLLVVVCTSILSFLCSVLWIIVSLFVLFMLVIAESVLSIYGI